MIGLIEVDSSCLRPRRVTSGFEFCSRWHGESGVVMGISTTTTTTAASKYNELVRWTGGYRVVIVVFVRCSVCLDLHATCRSGESGHARRSTRCDRHPGEGNVM